MDEKQAILSLKKGELNAMEFLVDQYYYPALHSAYLIVRDEDLAEDVVQTFFLGLDQKIHRFDDNLPFRPWMMKCIANASINALDGSWRFVSLDQKNWGGEDALIDFFDDQPSPEEMVITSEMRQEVWSMLGNLNPYQRAVIVMKYYLQFDEKEMVQALGKPQSSIKWWLRSAKQRLRQLFNIKEGNRENIHDVNKETVENCTEEAGHE